MNRTDNELELIIQNLRRLNIQQAEYIDQLEQLVHHRPNQEQQEVRAEEVPPAIVIEDVQPVEEVNEPREFRLGDLVRVRNPGLFQTQQGRIIKLGRRITIQDERGRTLWRAPNNLELIGNAEE
jgi:hypothetical protein